MNLSAEADPRTIDDILMAQQPPDASGAQAMPVVPPRQMMRPNDPAYNYDILQKELQRRFDPNTQQTLDELLSWQGYGEYEPMPYRDENMPLPGEIEDMMKRNINPHSPIDDDMIERSFRYHRDYGKRI